jgi:PAS domain S-box-containing protein
MYDLEKSFHSLECKEFIQNFPIGTYFLDFKKLKLQSPNDVILEYLGYTKEEFESFSPFDLLTPQSQKIFAERLEKISKNEEVSKFVEFEIKAKTGKTIWILLTTQWQYENKNPIGAFCIATNITQQKEIEFQLKEARDQAQLYLDMAFDIFVALNKEGKIILINRTGCNILGIQECFLIGQDWFDNYVPKEKREELKTIFQDILNEKYDDHEVRYTNPIITTTGETRLITWKNKVIRNTSNEITSVFCSGTDITEQAKLENELMELWKNGEKEIQEILKKRTPDFLLKNVLPFIPKRRTAIDSLDRALELVVNGHARG